MNRTFFSSLVHSFKIMRNFLLLLILLIVPTFVLSAQQIGDGFQSIIPNFGAPLLSGGYNGVNAEGMTPDTSHPWQHLFALRHPNQSNHHQMQLSSSFAENDRLFFRKIAQGGLPTINPVWNEIATRGANNFLGNQSISGNLAVGGNKNNSNINFESQDGFHRIAFHELRFWDWQTGELMTINNGNIGIGTTNPARKLEVKGNHSTSTFRVYYPDENVKGQDASIDIWASEPGVTYNGSGIGANVNGQPYYGRTNTALGQEFIRFIDGTTAFHNSSGDAVYSERMRIMPAGNVGIGTTKPDEKLTVNGNIHAKEVRVDLNIPPDYVFDHYYSGVSKLRPSYKMPSLLEVEEFVKQNHHLPEIPSAQEIIENGLRLAQMNGLLLQKVEELTLYAIEQQKTILTHNKIIENQNLKLQQVEKDLLLLKKSITIIKNNNDK
jgi:hypothetical protein